MTAQSKKDQIADLDLSILSFLRARATQDGDTAEAIWFKLGVFKRAAVTRRLSALKSEGLVSYSPNTKRWTATPIAFLRKKP